MRLVTQSKDFNLQVVKEKCRSNSCTSLGGPEEYGAFSEPRNSAVEGHSTMNRSEKEDG
jgi:hypothetical protein